MNKDEYETLPTTSVGVNMTAGVVAGIMEHCIMYPFDSVKVYFSYVRFSGCNRAMVFVHNLTSPYFALSNFT